MLAAVKFVRKIAAQPALAEIIDEEVAARPVDHLRRGPDPGFPKALRHGLPPGLDLPHGAGSDAARWSTRGCGSTGLSGLRVIDASIFPDNISGNTNAASIMTGWKGAETGSEERTRTMKITDVKTWVVGNPPPGIGGSYFIFVES